VTIKFGALLPQGWRLELSHIDDPIEQYELMTRVGLEAEASGYDSIWLFDHFHTVPTPKIETTFECWTAMAGLARDTSTIKLGQLVTCAPYRQPSLLAKMASCVDVMSHGRLILGLGAGWYEHEFRAYGYEFGDTPERLRKLRDAVRIVKAMWTEEKATYEGRYYSVRRAINEPKPVQRPHPPIWIGGSGEKVTLKLVAQYGDACNIIGSPDPMRHKLEVLKRHCEAVGRDYDSILKTANFAPIVGSREETTTIIKELSRRTGRPEEQIRQAQPPMTAEEAAAVFRRYMELGVTYFVYGPLHATDPGVLERFAREVIPLLA
jgi:F420-dependent oxidoreductase-like protein